MDHDTTDPHPEWDEDERERYFQRVIEKAAAKGQAEVATKKDRKIWKKYSAL